MERTHLARVGRWLWGAHAVQLMAVAAVTAPLTWVVLGLLAGVARKSAAQGIAPDPYVHWCLDRRVLFAAVAGSGLLVGAVMLLVRRWRWAWFLAGLALQAAAAVAVLACFVRLLAPLYQPVAL